MTTQTDTQILDRLLSNWQANLSRRTAEDLLSLRFSEADVARMNELAERAREGELPADLRREAESYNRIGHLMALLHSKARLRLKAAPDESRGS